MSIRSRLTKLNDLFDEKKVDGVLVTKRENYMYLSGFNSTSGYLIISPTERFLITDARYIEQASNQCPEFTIIDYKGNLKESLTQICDDNCIKSLGFESKNLSFDDHAKYLEMKFVSELTPIGDSIDKLRLIKDEEEINIIAEAARIADKAFEHVLKFIKPGVLEVEIAAEIEYYFKRNGAKGPSFDTIVASGKRSSLPHGVASDKKIEMGDPITLDFGCIFNDYCSDMTRTVFVGTPDPEMKKIYEIVKEAQEMASMHIVKGVTTKEADGVARNIITRHGYGERFGHGLGHGVGLEIHEGPSLSFRFETKLENNMVVTVEPGIYVPQFGGVRIEDMIVVNDTTPRILTSSTKEMIVL